MTSPKKTKSTVYNPTIYLRKADKKRLKRIMDDNDYCNIGQAVKLVLDTFDKVCKLEENPLGIGEVSSNESTD